MSGVSSTDFTCFHLAIIAYTVFLLIAAALRVGRRRHPYRSFCFLHLGCASLYLIAAAISRSFHFSHWLDVVVGLLCYFLLHYAFGAHLFSIATRSFSLNICASLLKERKPMTWSDSLSRYGDGKGIQYIKEDRIRVMLQSGLLAEKDGSFQVTPLGLIALSVNRSLLRLWGLAQLGSPKP